MLEILLSGGKRSASVETSVIAIEVLAVKMTTPIVPVFAVEVLTYSTAPPITTVFDIEILTKGP